MVKHILLMKIHVRVMDEKAHKHINLKTAIIATGSTPIEIPAFKYSERVINSTGALKL